MTLEQLVMYLWHGMPLLSILAASSALGGLKVYLDGKNIMRNNFFVTEAMAARADGTVVNSKSSSVGSDYDFGRKSAQRGLWIIAFSLLALISSTYL